MSNKCVVFCFAFVLGMTTQTISFAGWKKSPKTVKKFIIEKCAGDLMDKKTKVGTLRYSKEGSFVIFPEIAVDQHKNTWINDLYNRRLYALDSSGNIIRVVDFNVAKKEWNISLSGVTVSRAVVYINDNLYLFSHEGELEKTIKVIDSPGNIRVRQNGFIARTREDKTETRFDEIGNIFSKTNALELVGKLEKKEDGTYVIFDSQEFRIKNVNADKLHDYFFDFTYNTDGLFGIGEKKIDHFSSSGEILSTFSAPLDGCKKFEVDGKVPVDYIMCSDKYGYPRIAPNADIHLSHLNLNAGNFEILIYEFVK